MTRAVFDCMVFLQGAARPDGPAGACFRLIDENIVTLCVSADILAEVRDVLARPKMQQKFPLLTPDSVAEFVETVETKAIAVQDVPKIIALPRDPKDERYLNLALATASPYLVSRDKDLLDLMNDTEFRTRHPALTILDPVAFLRVIADQENPAPPSAPEP